MIGSVPPELAPEKRLWFVLFRFHGLEIVEQLRPSVDEFLVEFISAA